jgi:hypothetical protein
MRRPIFVALALVAAAATAVGVTAAVSRTPDSAGVSRVERVISTGWGGRCELDACAIGVTPIPYTTATGPATVDVTVTITLDYHTSRDDSARATLTLDDGTPPLEPMHPHGWPLGPARVPTTTTLTWIRKDLPAAGAEYTFQFSASPLDRNRNGFAGVGGTKLTVVIESWTAGD